VAELPLEGIRVIDLTVSWAGPFATCILADLGAEVIKIESRYHWQQISRGIIARPPESLMSNEPVWLWSYPDRKPGERPWNRTSINNPTLRNKYSMTVDLTRPEGMDIFKRLVTVSDVMVESNAPGTMEKLSITYDMLKQQRPDIIYLRTSAYGLSGPYSSHHAIGSQIEAITGHSILRWYPDFDLSTVQVRFQSDAAAGVNSAFAVIAALHHRNQTGEGQLIDLSQSENVMAHYCQATMEYVLNGRVLRPLGNRDYCGTAPCGIYPCKGEDRWVAINVTSEDEWRGFCRALGNPPWIEEERFSDNLKRFHNQDQLDKRIAEWTREHDHYALMHLLQKEGVPAGPVMDARDCYNDPHLRDREFFEMVTQEECGTHLYPGAMYKLSATPLHIRMPPVRMGEHNEYVYKQVIGVSEEEYSDLETKGHIGMDYVPEIM
jgi:crotonobetainyl-CoA:carnitine CoA-transferase CaiB-like acyl-CoA transferase